jgi:hypothetical protein
MQMHANDHECDWESRACRRICDWEKATYRPGTAVHLQWPGTPDYTRTNKSFLPDPRVSVLDAHIDREIATQSSDIAWDETHTPVSNLICCVSDSL